MSVSGTEHSCYDSVLESLGCGSCDSSHMSSSASAVMPVVCCASGSDLVCGVVSVPVSASVTGTGSEVTVRMSVAVVVVPAAGDCASGLVVSELGVLDGLMWSSAGSVSAVGSAGRSSFPLSYGCGFHVSVASSAAVVGRC